jgi:ABC-2 type transport system permease protein
MTTLAEYATSRELLVNLTLRELRSKYKRSTLGWAWSLINPLAILLIYTLVFRFFLKVEPPTGSNSGMSNFGLFVLTGLLPWNYLVTSTTGSIGTLVGNANLLKKAYFPRELLVVAHVGSWLISLLIELGLLAVAFLVFGNMVLPFIPVAILLVVMLTLFVVGLGLALSVVNVYFRDVQHFMGIFFQLWFFLTPIVYPISLVPQRVEILGRDLPLRALYDLNPMVSFVKAFRRCFYDLALPSVGELAILLAVSVTTFSFGLLIFNGFEGRLAEEL